MSSVNNSRSSPQPQLRTPLQGNSVGVTKNGDIGRSPPMVNQNSGPGQINRSSPANMRPKPQSPGPGGPNNPVNKAGPVNTANKAAPGASPPPGKRVVMRLRCKYRPLHDSYFQDGSIVDQDTDAVFICGDGGRVKGHRIILASTSKFFSAVFAEQRSEEISYVSVPWIRSDVMKLVLMLAYKEKVVLTAEQMDNLKSSAEQLGMKATGLLEETVDGDVKLDVKPGKVMDSLPKPAASLPTIPTLVARPPAGHMLQSPQRRPVPAATGSPHQRRVIPNNINAQGYESEDSESDEYQFQLQGYDQQHRRQLSGQRQPRVETERDEMDTYHPVQTDPVQAHNMIKEWMSKVGQDDGQNSHSMAPEQKTLECSVCNASFLRLKAYKWHEERHVGLGLFKCTQCDELLKTSRAVWSHEQNVHHFSSIPLQELEEPRAIPPNFQVVENRRQFMGQGPMNSRPNMPNRQPTQYNAANTIRLNQLKRLKQTKFGPGNSSGEHFMMPSRGSYAIGNSRGSEYLDTRKVKQLHWLYVCAKCDNCSDSSHKAMIHYSKCYPLEEVAFESTVTKYRQGFYGKSQCPLCPRRYTANGGFMIHCGHQHPQYRKLFSHTGSVEDKLKCTTCERKFSYPDDFHEHLENGVECTKTPITDDSTSSAAGGRGKGGSLGGSAMKANRKPAVGAKGSPAGVNETKAKTPAPKVTPVKVTPPVPAVQPRSARLAQRASMMLAKQIAKAEQEEDEQLAFNQRIGTTKRRASSIEYPPADCPICGASDVSNISLHLAKDHEDLKMTVNRISTDLLKCRKCLITFAICDLLGHVNSCTSANEDGPAPSRTPTPDPESNQAPDSDTPEHIVVDVNNLPPGIGSSPIDRIENTDLFSKETLRKALVCGVCNYSAPKFGDIAACLKSHGIHRCVLCFNSYCNRADYSTHLKKCHGQPGAGNGAGKLKCPLCNKLFQNAGQVASHMYTGHWTTLLKEMRESIANGEDFSKDLPNSVSSSGNSNSNEDKSDSKEETAEPDQSMEVVEDSAEDKETKNTEEDVVPPESLQQENNEEEEKMETSEEAVPDEENVEADINSSSQTPPEPESKTPESDLSKTDSKAEVSSGEPVVIRGVDKPEIVPPSDDKGEEKAEEQPK